MNCSACGQALEYGETQCPFCGTEAPQHNDLVLDLTPPAQPSPPKQATPNTPREPAARQQTDEPWRDEVRNRVHERRRDKGFESDLPLFAPRAQPPRSSTPQPPPAPRPPAARIERTADDLPLRAPEPSAPEPSSLLDDSDELPGPAEAPGLSPGSWLLGDTPSASRELPAVERPAAGLERAQAAAVDIALLFLVWGVILYFSGKATRVGLSGLRPSWPVVIGYLVFVGLAYAAYFTGVAGRTPGKMAVGLRVVDTQGQAPGLLRALLRAAFGVVLTAAAGIGLLPMLFDPARRALHDRLFGTRVIRV